MLRRTLALALFAASCGTDVQPFSPDGGNGSGPGGGAGLPCDVQAVLSNCTSCHGSPPSNGVPMPLVTYSDLIASSPMGGTYAQRAYLRMTSATNPMPPAPAAPLPASDIATFKAWLDAGMPAGDCGVDPLTAAPVCTSNSYWTGGDHESPRMHPGDACIACHAREGDAPQFTIAGTVYATGHEPAECNGTSQAQVVITDKNGQSITLVPNSAGNFYGAAPLAFPITAKVVAGGRERAMQTPQSSGDCNSCHTQDGTMMAPGRVTLP